MFKGKLLIGVLLGTFLVAAAGCNKAQTPPTTPAPSTQTAPQTAVQPSGTKIAQGDATKGKQLFDTNCSGCHNTDTTKKVGPGLKGIYSKSKLPNGQPVNDANLAVWMKTGNAQMPSNPALTDADTANIVAYLKTLK